jgi:hypothetical protein
MREHKDMGNGFTHFDSDDCGCFGNVTIRPPTSKNPSPSEGLKIAAQDTVSYLYNIDGEFSVEQRDAINRLRQLINEEFVRNGRQVSNQLIYNTIKEIL